MTEGPQLWVLAGGNGAGKSTFHRLFLAPRGLAMVNADRLARALRPEAPEAASYEAAAEAERLREHLLEAGASFCFETVFSHPSKVDFVARARALGYRIVIAYFHLGAPGLHLARVAQRVAAGGHGVPDEKVRARLPRLAACLRAALPLADEVLLFDNASADDPFRLVAAIRDGAVSRGAKPLPGWARDLIAGT